MLGQEPRLGDLSPLLSFTRLLVTLNPATLASGVSGWALWGVTGQASPSKKAWKYDISKRKRRETHYQTRHPKPRKPPRSPPRLPEAPGVPRRPPEALEPPKAPWKYGYFWEHEKRRAQKPSKAPGGPGRPPEAPGGPRAREGPLERGARKRRETHYQTQHPNLPRSPPRLPEAPGGPRPEVPLNRALEIPDQSQADKGEWEFRALARNPKRYKVGWMPA